MKKLLGSAMTLALLFPSGPAGAELLKNVKLMGGLDVQSVSGRNIADFSTHSSPAGGGAGNYPLNNDRLQSVGTRVWAGLGWDLLDDVHANVTLRKNDRTWGTTGNVTAANGSQAIGHRDTAGTATNGILGNIYVDQANVKLDKVFGHVDATVGRQFWGDPGDLIAFWGPTNAYTLPVTAIDALSVMASNDWMNFMGIAGRTTGNTWGTYASVAGAANDVNVRGIDVGWKMLPVKVNTFIWQRVTHGTGALGVTSNNGATLGGVNDILYVYGAKLRGEAMGGWFNATVALNSGQNRDVASANVAGDPSANANYIGKALLVDLGYKLEMGDTGGLTPWLNWGWGSGRHDSQSKHNEDFRTIASDFRPGVIYGRFPGALGTALSDAAAFTGGFDGISGAGVNGVSSAGLTNRVIWGGGVKFNPGAWNKLTAGLSYWDFNYQRATRRGPTVGGDAAAMGNRHIGSEVDFQLDWAHSENVMLSAGYASFQPGGFIKETIRAKAPATQEGSNPASLFFADLGIKF
ncbi:MAG: hypothetical protein HY554_02060 [Elusimicrobia bacterium]|nr:hypothetical protein [Elusimicrobiota bacterium]